ASHRQDAYSTLRQRIQRRARPACEALEDRCLLTGGLGNITEFPLPVAGSVPLVITSGPDGNLWFTEYQAGRIARISTSGGITEFNLSNASSLPASITTGPDGNLWFTEYGAAEIGRITPTGTITEFPVLTADSEPADIKVGPDHDLWFTEFNA